MGKRWYPGVKVVAAAVLVVALAAAMLFLFSALIPVSPRRALLTVAVEPPGVGAVISVNGSASSSLLAEVPYTIQVKAAPPPGWRLSHWLVNGSRVLGLHNRSEKLREWLRHNFEWIGERGYVPEVHLSNCWVLGGGLVLLGMLLLIAAAILKFVFKR